MGGGGFRGLVTRDHTGGLSEEVADRIFAAKPGDIVGPFQSDGVACIVRVEESGRLPLDGPMRQSIRTSLGEQALAERAGVCGPQPAPQQSSSRGSAQKAPKR